MDARRRRAVIDTYLSLCRSMQDGPDFLAEAQHDKGNVRRFIDTCCCLGPGLEIPKASLYEAYKDFSMEEDGRAVSCEQFFRNLYQIANISNVRRSYRSTLPPSDCSMAPRATRQNFLVGITLREAE